MNERMKTLVLGVAKDFDRAATPMSHEFFVEHKIDIDECDQLCTTIASILEGFVKAPQVIQAQVLVAGAARNAKEAAAMTSIVGTSLRANRAMKELKRMTAGGKCPHC